MIYFCPYCGHRLRRKLQSGITTCDCCDRIFDSSSRYRVLSAAWAVRKWHADDISVISSKYDLTKEEECLVNQVVLHQYSPQEFHSLVERAEMGI